MSVSYPLICVLKVSVAVALVTVASVSLPPATYAEGPATFGRFFYTEVRGSGKPTTIFCLDVKSAQAKPVTAFLQLAPIAGEEASDSKVYLGGADAKGAHLVAFTYSDKTDTATVQSINLQTKKIAVLSRNVPSLFAHPSPFDSLVGIGTTGDEGATTFYDTRTGKLRQVVPLAKTKGALWSWFGASSVAVEDKAAKGFALYSVADGKRNGEIALPAGNIEYTLFNERGYLISAIGDKLFITAPNRVTSSLIFPSYSDFGDLKTLPSQINIKWSPNHEQERFAFRVIDDNAVEAFNAEPSRDVNDVLSPPYYFGIAKRSKATNQWDVSYLLQYIEMRGTGADIELVGWLDENRLLTICNKWRGSRSVPIRTQLVSYDVRKRERVVLATLPHAVWSYAWVPNTPVNGKAK